MNVLKGILATTLVLCAQGYAAGYASPPKVTSTAQTSPKDVGVTLPQRAPVVVEHDSQGRIKVGNNWVGPPTEYHAVKTKNLTRYGFTGRRADTMQLVVPKQPKPSTAAAGKKTGPAQSTKKTIKQQ